MSSTKQKRRRKPKYPHSGICKPCWELKYCPYGPYVEHFPLHSTKNDAKNVRRAYERQLARFAAGEFKTEDDILFAVRHLDYLWPENWEVLEDYDTRDIGCRVFGHVCPVFLICEGFTETKEGRRIGRHIPSDIMLKVVRRDGQICQICNKPVPDAQVEFDHIIPFSRGGPLTADNFRLTCRPCNRKKRDSLEELLAPEFLPLASKTPRRTSRSPIP
jgi:hypothetical protein